MDRAKAEAISHWAARPCGAEAGRDLREGSPAFFESVDRGRYVEYAPWLPKLVRFDRFAGSRVLEVGCGMGTDLFQFAKAGADVTGIDLVPRHLAIARSRFQLAAEPARFVLADAEDLPFERGSFDVAYSFGVLHHTPNIRRAVAEIHRVLRPGGRAIVAVYNLLSFNFVATLVATAQEGRLFRQSFARTLSRIEGATAATPLVQVHTWWQLRGLLGEFREAQLVSRHVDGPLAAKMIPPGMRPFVDRHFGWYLVAEAVK